ncbi:hypothetical protein CBR_g11976 [Chara braunii]|uniref:Uncharacterized protein n=1 Tax=Chara braunii TaxID=69332 RepID=A0A388KQX0_CHABU|nr:hypothetical protein CBR_g11976 [Chara braunii]|eukprot:GBG72398.1 hypothetical protein CBR_g11976 [Chara braunii]
MYLLADPAMQTEFTVIQSQGVASFECNCKQQDDESFQSTSYHSYGETQPYTFNFVMKRASFSLKRNKKTELKEQYGPNLTVEIPVGQARICIVHLNDGKRIELELPDSRRRDILVLSLREFIKKALFEIRPEKKNRGFLFRGK